MNSRNSGVGLNASTPEAEEAMESSRFSYPKPGQVYTYEDVPKYCRVYYRGTPGFVIDKGDHMKDGDARHIQVEFDEPIGNANSTDTRLIHENVVNKYLYQKKTLWIDFEHRLNEYTAATS